MLDFEFQTQTRLLFGKDALSKLPLELAKYGPKVLLVTGGKSVHASGLYDRVMKELKTSGKTVFEVSGVKPNPRVESVREGVAICKKEKIDLVLGVGGGSAIDAAKGMAAGALYEGDVWDLYQYKVPTVKALPIGCILTLAATGTEMNGNSVVSNLCVSPCFPFSTPRRPIQFRWIRPPMVALTSWFMCLSNISAKSKIPPCKTVWPNPFC
jgi:hypothetical protein